MKPNPRVPVLGPLNGSQTLVDALGVLALTGAESFRYNQSYFGKWAGDL